jgi:purine-binding chemotaxis protein CheW
MSSLSVAERPAEIRLPEGPEASGQFVQYLHLTAGRAHYAVRVELVREILEVGRMTQLPRMPTFVCGVMNLRGAVVPVIDLGARLGDVPTVVGRRTCVVIVDVPRAAEDCSTERMGMLVDAVQEVFDSTVGELEPVPRLGTRVEPRFIRSMVRVRGQATPELDIGNILDQRSLVGLITDHMARH